MKKTEGKLSRLWARLCILIAFVAMALALFGAWTDRRWLVLVAIVLFILSIVLRTTMLKCPHCGFRAASPQWFKSGTLHCPKCGEPFEYDK